ncbi:MAG: DUF268 domain-containing protein [Akkermansiaceae bacterium]|nr:DUF268 domain-containing protein [Akkermansiaceae bacterium]
MWFLQCYREWQRTAPPEWRADPSEIKACLRDRHATAGNARGHYFLQDLWAGRRVFEKCPAKHVDVGSRVDGFVAHVATFCPVEYVDIRPLESRIPRLTGIEGSIQDLPFGDHEVISLSSLHVIEHIGLGRYGEPIDPAGWTRALEELQRVLAPGGRLLIGTPCGRPRVVFHAHRIFDPLQIIDAVPELKLIEFSLIRDGDAIEWEQDADPAEALFLDYGCGLFLFERSPVNDQDPPSPSGRRGGTAISR